MSSTSTGAQLSSSSGDQTTSTDADDEEEEAAGCNGGTGGDVLAANTANSSPCLELQQLQQGSSTPPALPPRPPNLASSSSAVSRGCSTPSASTAATTLSLPQLHPPHIAASYARAARLDTASLGDPSCRSLAGLSTGPPPLSRDTPTSTSSCCWPRPRPRRRTTHNNNSNNNNGSSSGATCAARKYVLLCCLCGGLCLALGGLYVAIYFVLDANTTSMHYFQTLPTYVPAIPLIITGILLLAFVRKKSRSNLLLKLCGCLCLCSAVVCVVVTVTTTVIHMNRLQTLRQCAFQAATRTCTCFADIVDPVAPDAGLHYVFAGTRSCDAIHGVLYSCLRALFGISVIGILVGIFSCMLAYQLQSHEKKKEYWSQLESRCRYLSHGHHGHHGHHLRPRGCGAGAFPRAMVGVPGGVAGAAPPHCQCCAFADDNVWAIAASDIAPGSASSNVYSPTPAASVPIVTTAAEATAQIAAASDSVPAAQSRSRSSTLRSFRNLLMSLKGGLDGAAPSDEAAAANGLETALASSATEQVSTVSGSANPLWRRSYPEPSVYGFAGAAAASHLQHRIFPASCHVLSSLAAGPQMASASAASHLHPAHLPQYIWDPPPPYYSQAQITPTHNVATANSSSNMSAANGVQVGATIQDTPGGGCAPAPCVSLAHSAAQTSPKSSSPDASVVTRTSKSGLLPSTHAQVQTAVKVTKATAGYCYSLPSRRIRKKRKTIQAPEMQISLSPSKSVSCLGEDGGAALVSSATSLTALNAEEAALVQEVRLKLNALLLYKYEHEKATRELAEARQALSSLHKQTPGNAAGSAAANNSAFHNYCTTTSSSLPFLDSIPWTGGLTNNINNSSNVAGRKYGPGSAWAAPYRSKALGGRNRNSTSSGTSSVENKYETIGKSLSPYKIHPEEQPVRVSIRKQLQMAHMAEAAQSPSTVSSPTPSSSSHYAQISPLRGVGVPRETPTYFQEIMRSNAGGGVSQLIHKRGREKPAKTLAKTKPTRTRPWPLSQSVTDLEAAKPSDFLSSVVASSAPGSAVTSPQRSAAAMPECVYLRPEQNIPDVFGNHSKFRPIESSSSEMESKRSISRDDIVVTVRSAQV